MSESLWNAVDSYVATNLSTDMAAGGTYTTHVLQSVNTWAFFDTIDFEGMDLPFAIITSRNGDAQPAGHIGSTRTITDEVYNVIITLVCEGTKATATVDAKTLLWRAMKLMRTLRFKGISADDGSAVQSVVRPENGPIFRFGVDLYSRPTVSADKVYGVSWIVFGVRGTTA